MEGLSRDGKSRWRWAFNPFCLQLPPSTPVSGQGLLYTKARDAMVKPIPACQVGRNPPVEMRKKSDSLSPAWEETTTCLPHPPAPEGMLVGMLWQQAPEGELVGMLRQPAPEGKLVRMLWQPAWLKEVSERLERGSPPTPNPPLLVPLRETYEQAHLGISTVAI